MNKGNGVKNYRITQTDIRPSKRCRELASSPEYITITVDKDKRKIEKTYNKQKLLTNGFEEDSLSAKIDLRLKGNEKMEQKQRAAAIRSGRQSNK